jgi:predicted nucleic acid-binding Zn ribbon protein
VTEPDRKDLQPCVVCGRWFISRPEPVCSMTCKLKAEENNLPAGSVSGSSK